MPGASRQGPRSSTCADQEAEDGAQHGLGAKVHSVCSLNKEGLHSAPIPSRLGRRGVSNGTSSGSKMGQYGTETLQKTAVDSSVELPGVEKTIDARAAWSRKLSQVSCDV